LGRQVIQSRFQLWDQVFLIKSLNKSLDKSQAVKDNLVVLKKLLALRSGRLSGREVLTTSL